MSKHENFLFLALTGVQGVTMSVCLAQSVQSSIFQANFKQSVGIQQSVSQQSVNYQSEVSHSR